MRKKLLIILAAIVVILAGFAVVVALQPADFRITRSAIISAPPADVFAQVNDFHNWQSWSPWAKIDPAAKNSYEGPPSGKGAIFKWSGDDHVGEGTMTLLESRPDELIRIKLDFERPFKNSHTAEFTFKPEGKQTMVTWSMYGQNGFVGKALTLFMNMDKMIGGEFEKGLASMKSVVETKKSDDKTK